MVQLTTTVNTLNFSSTPGYSPKISWSTGVAPTVVMSICFLLGFPGNIAVIILKPDWETMSSLSQSLMLSLAVSDLLCMLTIPVWIYSFLNNWMIGLVLVGCKLITYFVYCSLYASLLTVTVLSVQRYLQVVHLQRSLNRVKARMLLVPLWLSAMILSTPALVFGQLSENQKQTTCKTLVGFVSLSVIVFSYISLYRKVNQVPFFNNPQTTRLITSITVTLVVLWMPYLVINVISAFDGIKKELTTPPGLALYDPNAEILQKIFEDSWRILGSVTFVNSAVNPLLYAFTSKRLATMHPKIAQQLIQKFRIPQNLYLSRDVSREVISQS
ncbi:gamma-crystallin [Sarotherodon galilaeus]